MADKNAKIKKAKEVLDRGTIVEILPNAQEFLRDLSSGKKLRFYIGFDPTASTLHLSHAKNFILMEKFRKLGHEVIILFGDFTARIGDPSGEKAVRKQLTREQVIANVKEWKKQVSRLMDFKAKNNPPRILYNHDWLSKLRYEEVIELASNFTVQQFIERDMFQKRLKVQKPIYLHEFLYPLMQGYDSVAMDVDVEVCGTDQIFNALVGRTLIKKLKNKNKYVVAVTLMENPKTGELMSKSKNIGVFLDADSTNLYGQIMAQPDEMIEILFVNCTLLSLKEIKTIMGAKNPRDAKTRLAFEITKLMRGEKAAKKAAENFEKQFVKKETPDEIKEVKITKCLAVIDGVRAAYLYDILVETGLTSSKSEGKRLIEQGGVKVDGATIGDRDAVVEPIKGMIIQIGKRKFVRIK